MNFREWGICHDHEIATWKKAYLDLGGDDWSRTHHAIQGSRILAFAEILRNIYRIVWLRHFLVERVPVLTGGCYSIYRHPIPLLEDGLPYMVSHS
jgi:hypothetical protein